MADDIKIKVGVQSDVKKGMGEAQRDISSIGSSMKNALGAIGIGFGIGAVISGIRSVISSIGQMADTAKQVDFSTENYQKLVIVAGEAGVKADELSAGLGKLIKAQENAASDPKLRKAFEDLGFSIEDVLRANPEQLFEMIAKGLDKTGNKAAIFDIFGRGAAKLIPTLADLKNGFDSVSNAGLVSDKTIQDLDKLDERLAKIGRTAKGLFAEGLVGFIDDLKVGIEGVKAMMGGYFKDFTIDLGEAPDAETTATQSKKADDEMAATRRVSEAQKEEARRVSKEQYELDKEQNQFDEEMWKLDQKRMQEEKDAIREQAEFERETNKNAAKELIEIDKKRFDEKMRLEDRAIQHAMRALDLQEKIGQNMMEMGNAQIGEAMNPADWNAKKNADREHDRDLKRKDAKEDELLARRARGVKLSAAQEAFLEGRQNAAMGERAKLAAEQEKNRLDVAWRKKQEAAADATVEMNKKIDAIAKG